MAPLLFDNGEHKAAIYDTPLGKSIFDDLLKRTGVRVLATGGQPTAGRTAIYNKVRPITKLDDLKGIRLRVPDAAALKTLQALGASPIIISMADTASAMATGMVDGVVTNPSSIIKSMGAGDYVSNCTWIAGGPSGIAINNVIVNEEWWQKLSPDVQQAMIEAAPKYMKNITEAMQLDNKQSQASWEANPAHKTFNITDAAEIQRWRDKIKPVYNDLAAACGDLGPKFMDTIESLRGKY